MTFWDGGSESFHFARASVWRILGLGSSVLALVRMPLLDNQVNWTFGDSAYGEQLLIVSSVVGQRLCLCNPFGVLPIVNGAMGPSSACNTDQRLNRKRVGLEQILMFLFLSEGHAQYFLTFRHRIRQLMPLVQPREIKKELQEGIAWPPGPVPKK